MYVRIFRVQVSLLALAAGIVLPSAALAQSAPSPVAQKPAEKREPIVVTGARGDVNARADRLSFDVGKDLQAQSGTLADALRNVPGVEVDLEGKVSLRGDPGVKILVDGRPSALFSGEGAANVIQSMPAGQIERVEVITNPSAAMSPEGSAGIINLVMKKARPDTRYATVRGNIGSADRYALSLNGVHSGRKLTVTTDLGFRRFSSDAESRLERVRFDPATGATVETSQRSMDMESKQRGGNGRVAIDYDLSKQNRVSTELNLFDFRNASDSEERFDSSLAGASYDRDAHVMGSSRGASGQLSWRRTFPGKEHELVSEVGLIKGRFKRDVDAMLMPESSPDIFEGFRNSSRWTMKSLKSEYKRPMGKDDALNIGYNGNFNQYDFDFFGARGPDGDALVADPNFTNQFEYDETIHAVFGTYSFDIGKLELMTGLRLEQVDVDIDQITDDLQFENDYFRAYPTLHVGYDLTETLKLRGSYSRRIQRPQAQDLNPYTIYIDPLNLRRGNPFLKPQVTDAFELSLQKRKGATFYSLTGFLRDSRDGVTDVFTDLGGGVILTTRANLGTSRAVGIDAIANGKLTKTLTYNASATWQRLKIDPRVGGVTQKRSGSTGSIRGNFNWQPTPKDFFQLNGIYNGRILLPQGYRKPGGMLNLGYRRKMNEKLSLLATAQNVLDSARAKTFFETPTTTDRIRQRGMGRVLFLGATYTFGNTNGRPRKEPGFDFQQGGSSDPVQ